MDNTAFPPWEAAGDETPAQKSEAFSVADRVVESFATKANGRIIERTYSISKQWGRLLRAKIAFEYKGRPSTYLVACWYVSDSEVAIVTKQENGWQ